MRGGPPSLNLKVGEMILDQLGPFETCQLFETSQTDQNSHIAQEFKIPAYFKHKNNYRLIVALWDLGCIILTRLRDSSLFLPWKIILDQFGLACSPKLLKLNEVRGGPTLKLVGWWNDSRSVGPLWDLKLLKPIKIVIFHKIAIFQPIKHKNDPLYQWLC